MITPNTDLDGQLAIMELMAGDHAVSAWKCYTPWGPNGSGWRLDDPAVGIPFIEKGLELGVGLFCCHKGLPLPGFDASNGGPEDVAIVAKSYPDAKFLVYHSAFKHGGQDKEGPYDPDGTWDAENPNLYPATKGINSLVHAIETSGLGKNSNVYAELGSVWSDVMTDPDQAAHILGKLLKHVGEDNVVWGTDSIWYGSPQPFIEAFRTFNISTEFQEKYGYPELTDAIKAKILGLNAAAIYGVDPDAMRCVIDKGDLAQAKRQLDAELGPRRWTASKPAGPRTLGEFWAHARAAGNRPT
jgi:hypothetical protein